MTRDSMEPPTPETRTRTDGTERTRSLGDLFRELSAESQHLLRQELALARAELRDSFRQLGGAFRQLSLGGAMALVGSLTLTAFAVVLLGSLLGNYWLAALIVAVLLLAGGGLLIHRGIARIRGSDLAPRRTLESLRTSGAWVGEEAASLRHALTDGARSRTATGVIPAAMPGTLPALPAGTGSGEATGGSTPAAPAGGGVRDRAEDRAASGVGLLKRTGREFMEDDIPGEAAKVAYYAFLALPPAILVAFSLTGFFGGSAAAAWITTRLQTALPESASELVDGFVAQVVYENAPGPFSIGLLLALWAASNVFMALGRSLNAAYDATEERSWIRLRAISIGVMLAAVALMIVASVSLIAGPQIASSLNLWGAAELAWNILQWPLAFLFVSAAFFIVYLALPNRDQSNSRGLLFRVAMAAAGLWLVASAGFRLYVSNFASYSETYGFLGAVIVLLLWLYVTGLVVLAGGELAAEAEEGRAGG